MTLLAIGLVLLGGGFLGVVRREIERAPIPSPRISEPLPEDALGGFVAGFGFAGFCPIAAEAGPEAIISYRPRSLYVEAPLVAQILINLGYREVEP